MEATIQSKTMSPTSPPVSQSPKVEIADALKLWIEDQGVEKLCPTATAANLELR